MSAQISLGRAKELGLKGFKKSPPIQKNNFKQSVSLQAFYESNIINLNFHKKWVIF